MTSPRSSTLSGIGSIALLLVAISAPGCREQAAPVVEPIRPVKMMTVGDPESSSGRNYPGTVRPNEQVDLAFQVPGQLIQLPVLMGDRVKQGTLLAKLDDRDYSNARAMALAKKTETENTYVNVQKLHAEGAARERELVDSKAAFDAAEAELRIRDKATSDCELKAPFDGIIATRFVENFENVQAKEKVMSLQQIKTVKVIVNLPERDIIDAPKAMPDRFVATFDSLPGQEFDLTMKEIATDADPVTQTFELSLTFQPPDNVYIFPGMTATVTTIFNFDPEKVTRFLVPAAAVLQTDAAAGEPSVWIVGEGGVVSRRPVEIGGIVSGNMIEVLEGLQPGETIATSGVHHLKDGQKVTQWHSSDIPAVSASSGEGDRG